MATPELFSVGNTVAQTQGQEVQHEICQCLVLSCVLEPNHAVNVT